MNFNGPQSGSHNRYVIGTLNDFGSQYGSVTIGEVRQAVRDLDSALATTPLPADARRTARDHVAAVEEEMRLDRPDERTVVQHLDSLGRVLGSAGSVVTAGSALFGPLKTFAA